jgi:hypothetical protein
MFDADKCSFDPKHYARSRRLTGVRSQLRPLATMTARSLAMVVAAIVLILVLLPAVLAAQAAGMS